MIYHMSAYQLPGLAGTVLRMMCLKACCSDENLLVVDLLDKLLLLGLQGKSVKQPSRPDSPGGNSDERRRPGARRLSSRSSFEEQATLAQYDLAAAITPAIERLLQVVLPACLC